MASLVITKIFDFRTTANEVSEPARRGFELRETSEASLAIE